MCHLSPTYPWLALIGQPEARRGDGFGAASWRDLVAKSLTPVLVVRLQVAEWPISIAAINRKAPDLLRRGWRVGRVRVGSGEPQLDALPGPVPFELTVGKKGLCAEPGRMTTMQDGLRDLRSEIA